MGGVATGDESETIYMVTSGTHYNGKCCWDYGNAETDNFSHGPGTMEAVYFGSGTGHLAHRGRGKGPWIMADLESGGSGGTPGHWAIKGGNAQSGKLRVLWDGPRPGPPHVKRWPGGKYAPMKMQGAIILGVGGDNSNGAVGTFYEGCMTKGFSTDETDDAVPANIVAAKYAG